MSGGHHDGRFLLAGTELITFKVRGSGYAVFENATQPGYGGPPPHRHLRQDEGFYVLEGRFTFQVDGHVIPAPPGTFVNVPEGRPAHISYRGPRDRPAARRGGTACYFESFVEEVGEPVSTVAPPPLPAKPPGADLLGRIVAAGAKHHLKIEI